MIESGVDFEKSVLNIFQSARTDEEIQQEFDFLQENLQDKIDKDLKDARNKIFASFDEQVVTKLRTRKGAIDTVLDNFTRSLITIAKAELPDASFDTEGKPQFEHEGKTWSTEWPLAEENGWQFFRLSDGNLAQELVDEAKARELPNDPHLYEFSLSGYPMRLADVEELQGKTGWLRVSKITVQAAGNVREELILTCFEDNSGKPVSPETAQRFFVLPATKAAFDVAVGVDYASDIGVKAIIAEREAGLVEGFREDINKQNEQWLDEESEKLDAYADDLEKAAEAEIKELEAEIKDAKKALRTAADLSMKDKLAEKRRIKRLEGERDDKRLMIFQRRKEIRQEVDDMLDEIAESLDSDASLEHLFTIRWGIQE